MPACHWVSQICTFSNDKTSQFLIDRHSNHVLKQQAGYNRILNTVNEVFHGIHDEEAKTRPHTRQSMMSMGGRRKRISESELPGLGPTQSEYDRMSKHGARDSMDPETLDRALAGGQIQYDDDEVTEDDDDSWDEYDDGSGSGDHSYTSDEEGTEYGDDQRTSYDEDEYDEYADGL